MSVKVTNCKDYGTVFITGDLFEKEEDIKDSSIWMSAGSYNEQTQQNHRYLTSLKADYIIPGHGPMFKMTVEYREILLEQLLKDKKFKFNNDNDN